MSQIYRCPLGHQWEDSFGGASLTGDGVLTCPVCGAAVADAATPSQTPTRLAIQLLVSPAVDARPAPIEPSFSGHTLLTPNLPAVAGYEILSELGRGGMGVVYKARQQKLNRLVALKMVLAGDHTSPTGLARFRIEAEAVARIQHPNIVQIYEVGEQNGLPYFSMELVDGGSLAEKADDKPQPARWSAGLVETLARAMHTAHQRGIVHRDLKPANILLASGGREPSVTSTGGSHPPLAEWQPKITDFGLAKQLDTVARQTRTGDIMGTPSYMAPEQAEGRSGAIGPHTDVYALGAILYELLTGRPPFQAETAVDTLLQVLYDEPVPPLRLQARLPRDLDTICVKCLQKAPIRRYPSAEALADDLRRYLHQEPIQARPITTAERLVKWARRRPAVAALLACSTLLAVALFGLSVYANVALNAAANRERLNAQEANEQRAIARDNERQAQENATEANTQKQEAQAQRQRAEDNLRKAHEAVDQMLTVVGKDFLEDVPGFDAKRTELLSSAVDFYHGFLQKRSQDPKVRRETGQTYFNLGTLYRGLRQHDAAAKAYRQAIALQSELIRQFPAEPGYRQELAISYTSLGETLRTKGLQLGEAEHAYDSAEKLQEQLVNADSCPAYRQELARTHYNRGILRMDTGRRRPAREDFEAAIGLLTPLTESFPQKPDYRQGLARCFINRGILLKETDQPDAAETDYSEAIRLLTELHRQYLARSDYRHELAVSHINRGNLLSQHKRYAEAATDFRTALPLLQRLHDDFTQRPAYCYELANCFNSLAAVLWATNELAGARKLCEQSLALHRQLVAESPNVPDYRSALAGSLDNLAALLRDQKPPQLDEARQLLQEAQTHHQEAIKTNSRHRTFCQRLRDHYTGLAEVLLRQKDHAAAAQAVTELVQVFPDDWQRYHRAAGVLARCMLQADEDKHLQLAQEYAERATAMLREAIRRGFTDTGLLTMPAFKALRQRHKDCDRMLRELEKKLQPQ